MKKVLIAEDEINIATLLRLYLEKEGYEVKEAHDGVEALSAYKSFDPTIILLDIMMPKMNGYEVCKKIRETSNVPIIMLTAKGDVFDKVSGLDLGADDYVTKPFEIKELLARMSAVLRRTGLDDKLDSKDEQVLNYDNLIIDMSSFELTVAGKKVDTPPKEMELLFCLASNPNKVYTRNQLLDEVWGFNYFGDTRTVDVHVKRLREKLDGISDKWELKTVWGVGYKFEVIK